MGAPIAGGSVSRHAAINSVDMRTAKCIPWIMTLALAAAQPRSSGTLNVYVIDVEGGNATLFVSPSHESLLIDTGNAGAPRRAMPVASWMPLKTPGCSRSII